MSGVRVLQVLADTDDVDEGRVALDLHGALGALGAEVRTVALGPGRRGGLETEVPLLSPSRRSIAAHTQLRREQRWADVVLLRGAVPAGVAGLAGIGGAPPSVVAVGEECRTWAARPVPSRVRRLLDRGATVVATDPDGAAAVAAAIGRASDAVVVIPVGVAAGAPTSAPQRDDARRQLGLGDPGTDGSRLVARFVGGPGRDDGASIAAAAAAAAGVTLLDDGVDPELAVAAADVAVLPTVRRSGPPRGLLLAARSGAALVAPADGALSGLVDRSTGRPAPADEAAVAAALAELAADPALRLGAGSAAAERAAAYRLDRSAVDWLDVLSGAAAGPS